MDEEMILVNKRRVEVLKVFYALFTTLIDTEPETLLVSKLRALREKLREVEREIEQ